MFILKESLNNSCEWNISHTCHKQKGTHSEHSQPHKGIHSSWGGPQKALVVLKGASWGWDTCEGCMSTSGDFLRDEVKE